MLITADRVWDGLAEPLDHGFVAVDDGLITAVGRQAELGSAFDHHERVDLGAATLLPGLINAHVHLALSGSATIVDDFLTESSGGAAVLMARAIANLETAARGGVTTVRDVGSPNPIAFAARDAGAAGLLPLPRVVTSGEPITITGGHCHWFSHECDNEDQVRQAVRHQVKAGADLVKIFATGGNLTPRTNPYAPQYSAEELLAATTEARRLGVPVAAHAHAPEGIRRAVAAGVSTIEHCLFETVDGVEYDPGVADVMAAGGIAFCPTLGAGILVMMGMDPADLPPIPRRLTQKSEQFSAGLRDLIARGVRVVAGNDAGGIPNRTFADYGADVGALADPRLLALSPRDALVAATSGAAAVCGLSDTGALVPGRRADIVAVDGDPLTTIADLTRTRLVLIAGRVVPRPVADLGR